MMLSYVTFDRDSGDLLGAFLQEPPEGLVDYIAVDEQMRLNWPLYRMNARRDGLELREAPEQPAPSEAELVAAYEKALDGHIDQVAQSYGYMSILTAISYAEEPAVPRFQLEGRALRAWRSLCYAKAHEILAEVKSGEREAPSVEDFIAEMPVVEMTEAS